MGQFPIGGPLEPGLYLQPFSRLDPKHIGVTTLTFLGHVTSSVSIYNKLVISHYNQAFIIG